MGFKFWVQDLLCNNVYLYCDLCHCDDRDELSDREFFLSYILCLHIKNDRRTTNSGENTSDSGLITPDPKLGLS